MHRHITLTLNGWRDVSTSLLPFSLLLTRNALGTTYFLHNCQSYLCERVVQNSQNVSRKLISQDPHGDDIQNSGVNQEGYRNFQHGKFVCTI